MKRRYLTILAIAAATSACQEPVIVVDEYDDIRLLNNYPVEARILALEEELAFTVDPVCWFDLDDPDLPPGWAPEELRVVENIDGYTYGDDVALLVYMKNLVMVGEVEEEKFVLSLWLVRRHVYLLETDGVFTIAPGTGPGRI